ncbi:MAG TPA: carboxylesterase/lipase family protein [Candidatus Dormibacteraeota bacterium]|nr:carboxylesterase/lipase family protein [Candidatus Dormibacteraeota bacterium]
MTQVETRWGTVEGIEKDGVLQFRGIPFASSPVGALRWRAPQPPEPWTGVRPAHEFGPMAPQGINPLSLFATPKPGDIREDGCLTLNVFTGAPGGDPRPVMVWIHGGAFTADSGRDAWYNGTSFAKRGVVVVTVNYRLGALGFLHLGDDFPGSGNVGLLDQVAALEWVRDNIAAFGGDPGNVTIFGESAGGMSVGSLLGMPAASGLFHKAIPQSGAASTVNNPERAGEVAERLLARVGGIDGLRTAPWERLIEVQGEVVLEMTRGGGGLPFEPVMDGVVLPRVPLETVAAGAAPGVRLLTGTTRDEMTLFLIAAGGGGGEVDEATAVRRIERQRPGAGHALYDAYRDELGAGTTPRDVWVAVETDRVFRMPAIHLAEAQARHTPDVWMYLFTWESPILDGALRACHALEIPFVWNTLATPGAEGFTGTGPAADALAHEMHSTWVAFARTGDPGWERYEEGRRATRVFGPGSGVAEDPRGSVRRFWDPVPA